MSLSGWSSYLCSYFSHIKSDYLRKTNSVLSLLVELAIEMWALAHWKAMWTKVIHDQWLSLVPVLSPHSLVQDQISQIPFKEQLHWKSWETYQKKKKTSISISIISDCELKSFYFSVIYVIQNKMVLDLREHHYISLSRESCFSCSVPVPR